MICSIVGISLNCAVSPAAFAAILPRTSSPSIPEEARRVALGGGEGAELVLRLADGLRDGGVLRPLDEISLLGARDERVEPDVVHVDVAPDAGGVVRRDRDLASGHDEEPPRHVEARRRLGERPHAHFGLAVGGRAPQIGRASCRERV